MHKCTLPCGLLQPLIALKIKAAGEGAARTVAEAVAEGQGAADHHQRRAEDGVDNLLPPSGCYDTAGHRADAPPCFNTGWHTGKSSRLRRRHQQSLACNWTATAHLLCKFHVHRMRRMRKGQHQVRLQVFGLTLRARGGGLGDAARGVRLVHAGRGSLGSRAAPARSEGLALPPDVSHAHIFAVCTHGS